MSTSDSDASAASAQTASLKSLLTTVGYEYLLHRQRFEEFLDGISALADEIPSLVFHRRTDTQIEFTYLGQRYCIRHAFQQDAKTSVLTSLSRASPQDESYTPKHSLTMDRAGSLVPANGQGPWSVRGGSERAFYYLLLGQ